MVQINANIRKEDKGSITVVTTVDGQSRTDYDPELHDAYVTGERPPEKYKEHDWVMFHKSALYCIQFSANDTRNILYAD